MPLPKTTQGVYRLSVSTFISSGFGVRQLGIPHPGHQKCIGVERCRLGVRSLCRPGGADVRHGAIRLPGWPLRQPENTDGGIRFLSCRACMPGYGGVFLGTGGRVIFFGVAANLTNISVNTQGVGVERLYRCSIMALGRFTADRLVMRFGPVRVLRASGILIASGLLVSVLFPMLWSATLGFLLVGFGTSSHCPALLQHGREIPENDSQHGAGFRLHHWLSGVPDGPSGHRAYRPCFLPPVVFLPDCPDWTGDGSYRSFTQKI